MTFDHSSHLGVLGRLAANGQALEASIALLLARELGVEDRVGLVVAGRSNSKGVLSMIADLTTSDETRAWVKRTGRALEGRNRYIHGFWASTEEDGDLSIHIQRGNFAQVDDPAKAMGEVADELYACFLIAKDLSSE